MCQGMDDKEGQLPVTGSNRSAAPATGISRQLLSLRDDHDLGLVFLWRMRSNAATAAYYTQTTSLSLLFDMVNDYMALSTEYMAGAASLEVISCVPDTI